MTTGQRLRPPGPSGVPAARLTKTERREKARREHDRELQLERRMRKLRLSLGVVALAVVASVAIAVVSRSGGANEPPRQAEGLPGELTTEAPWPANAGDLPARLALLGLPAEGAALHVHSHLDIYVNGVHEPVPADLGIGTSEAAPIHTHDPSGIIHLESAEPHTFTLGELFDVWGVRLTSGCIGAYCETGANRLWAFVDGEQHSGSLASMPLSNHSEIVLAYGPQDSLPDPIPEEFDFGAL